jgi:NDP-sugar pyrophosphorylase family protein
MFERQIPIACAEVLGQPIIARVAENLRRSGIEAVMAFGTRSGQPLTSDEACSEEAVAHQDSGTTPTWMAEAWSRVEKRRASRQDRSSAVLIVRVGAYAEFDPIDMLRCHQAGGDVVTRAFDDQGPLDIWMADASRFEERNETLTALRATKAAQYEVRGYVNRLESPRDLRRLAVDGFQSRCWMRPSGSELRPGVWIGEGVQVERTARIVAPAFIGRGVRIADECLITRCSNVEGNSEIDFGTIIEDSSILANSYVGIGLEVTHSIVDGNNLLNLHHDVRLLITDPVVMRQNKTLRDSQIDLGRGTVVSSAAFTG